MAEIPRVPASRPAGSAGGPIDDPSVQPLAVGDVAEVIAGLPHFATPATDERLYLVEARDLAPLAARLRAQEATFVTLVGIDARARTGGFAVEAVFDPASGDDHTGVAGAGRSPLIRLRATLPADRPAYPSLSRVVPAAQWDEREAKDLFRIMPEGHPDPRRLVLHERWPRGYHPLRKEVPASEAPAWGDRRFTPFQARGEGLYQLPVGPIHAGIIEPGHFRFSAVGESVLYLEARLFFTHRGLEKLVEGRTFASALPIVERACGVCTVTHALAFSEAVERLTGTIVPERARWGRVLLAELERVYNHVGDLGNLCAGTGLTFGSSQLAWLKERLLRVNESITGHRYLTGVVGPGGLRADLDAGGLEALPATLDGIEAEVRSVVRSLNRTDSFMERLHGTGIVTAETARTLGALGVAARASGLTSDLRRTRPTGAYGELEVPLVQASTGDVAARFHVRAQETMVSMGLIRQALRRMPEGPVAVPLASVPEAGASALGAHEGPRGASWIWLAAGPDGIVERLRLRSASYANWPVVAAAVPGNLVPDFPLINKSFELCYACTDR